MLDRQLPLFSQVHTRSLNFGALPQLWDLIQEHASNYLLLPTAGSFAADTSPAPANPMQNQPAQILVSEIRSQRRDLAGAEQYITQLKPKV